jgi:hypothetical protein
MPIQVIMGLLLGYIRQILCKEVFIFVLQYIIIGNDMQCFFFFLTEYLC